MIHIRPATISDAEVMLRVHYAAVHGSATATFYTQNILQSWSPSPTDECHLDRLHQSITNSEKLIIVAVSAETGLVVGFGSIVPSKQELRALYVDPTFTCQGVGTKILANLEELALLYGANKLYLDASLNAEKFYLHHGYLVVNRGTHRLSSGLDMDCIYMSKELRAEL